MKLTMTASVRVQNAGVIGTETSEFATAEFDIISDDELDTALKQWDKVTKKLGLEEEDK